MNKPAKSIAVQLARMTEAEFRAFRGREIRGYADFQVAASLWVRRGARARARTLLDDMLPQGPRTPAHYCLVVRDRRTGAAVGHLWVAEIKSSGRPEAYIYDIEIVEAHRGRGYGAAVLRALATWARRRRLPVIRLRVHAHNTGARALYEKMGFAVTDVMMALPLKDRRRQRP